MSIESQKLLRVKSEVLNEVKNLKKIEQDLKKWKTLHNKSRDSFDLRAAGSLLQDFYTCIERIFERVARELNGGIPVGEDWHRELLYDMALSIEKVRPAVTTERLKQILNKYLKFRHLFRNIYGFELNWERMKFLVEELSDTLRSFEKEISVFCKFLEQTAERIKN